ncbi:long-chain-fatty-acid--CoA ligase [Mycobacterium nebraskense]|uniref:Long-chain-fatty-acid--CoA ligase FadD13 n=1 Tax=Mycobacterium nebraskense TaxID=244292 RepID=A0A1X1ZBL5_9MYCO|nr:long-chain-fatty-acid--CoA ligase [Mycobacterium nebraskense]KKC05037.1 fatty-acid--CoA ligase [Mycobacterium nebraskense]MBI2695205.1 long-chain-fatty-acid--CoA ligase [Mycobacterium nebraskense]MCV7118864.1 long-chain-fatty-acid--CoA ligase [Mycobacterium nebraskense]ORW20797.1 fatty-acid--CoA ligase [Mycobacterium nebraskense]
MYVTQSLHRMLQQCPDMPLTVFADRQRTVRQSADRIARLAGALRAQGVRRGERVAFLGLNSDRYHEYLYAVPWADAAVNPVNIRWSPAEIAYSLRDSGTTVLFVDDAFAAAVPQVSDAGAELSTLVYCGEGPCPPGMLDYESLIDGAQPIPDPRRGGDELYGIFYTGGTTGHPKGVMLSHNNVMTSALGCLATGRFLTDHGRILYAAPLFHLAAIGMWIAGNVAGSTHVMVPSFTPGGVAEAISNHQVTDVLLVPTMIQMLIDHPDPAGFDLTSLRHLIYGASPISEALVDRAQKAFPNTGLAQAYGMTELAPAATFLAPADHDNPRLQRSAGRALPHVEVRVVDASDDEVPPGEIGEVIVRGDNVMLGYWNRPAETAATVRDGWMHTGDMARMDEHGYLFIVDRLKDMIITGGENVYSAEVENALAGHPTVAAAAVIGVPDDQWGERVHAVIVLRAGSDPTEESIREHCRTLIAGYKVPRSMEFVTDLPISGAGKVLKRELRERYRGPADTR